MGVRIKAVSKNACPNCRSKAFARVRTEISDLGLRHIKFEVWACKSCKFESFKKALC